MIICNTGVLLASNGNVLCDLIHVCSDDMVTRHTSDNAVSGVSYVSIRYTHEFHDLR